MYMNGRGPMTGGHRGGPGFGGPVHHRPMGPGMGTRPMMGYVPGMGFRPMRVHRRPMGFFPMGGLFLLPALMFGGWIAVAAVAGVLSVIGSIFEEALWGLSSLASGAFSGGGLAVGIVIGVIAFYWIRNRNAKKEEAAATVDGEEVETEIAEPVTHTYRAD